MTPVPIDVVKRFAGRFCPFCKDGFHNNDREGNNEDLLSHLNEYHLKDWKELLATIFDFSHLKP